MRAFFSLLPCSIGYVSDAKNEYQASHALWSKLSWLENAHSRQLLLPDDVTAASSLLQFQRKLKTHLFQQSYPDVIL